MHDTAVDLPYISCYQAQLCIMTSGSANMADILIARLSCTLVCTNTSLTVTLQGCHLHSSVEAEDG